MQRRYLQLDLDAERVIAERTVEDGLELGFGLWRLDLRTLFLCHSIVFPVFLCVTSSGKLLIIKRQ